MLLKTFERGSETAVLRSGACKRSLAVIACVSVLAGCESVPDFPSYSDMKSGLSETIDQAVMSIEKSWENRITPVQGAVTAKEETTPASGSAEPMLTNSPF